MSAINPTRECVASPRVAVDGPAGAGKTTVAAMFARRVSFRHIDSGAMYRAVTLEALYSGSWSGSDDEELLVDLAANLDISFEADPVRGMRVNLRGVDCTGELRLKEVDEHVSVVARAPGVRGALLGKQRQLAEGGGVVMDGRDIGTCVLPDAEMKVYLTAAQPVRIARRLMQLRCGGSAVSWAEAARSVVNRDRIDSTRTTAPLRPAEDAIIIDSTHLNRHDVVKQMEFILADRVRALRGRG